MAQQKAKTSQTIGEDTVAEPQQQQSREAAREADGNTNIQPVSRTRAALDSLWKASVGVAVTAQHRSGKFFKRMAEKGERYQHLRAQQPHEQATAEQQADNSKLSTVERIHNLEHRIEDRLDRGRDSTLHWIGVPSNKEFEELQHQVEELRQQVESLRQEHITLEGSNSEVPVHL